MTEAMKEWDKTLREIKLLQEGDEIEEFSMANYYEKVLIFKNMVKGNLFFTKKCVIFCSTFGVNNLSIPYEDIKEVDKCITAMVPGFYISAYDSKKNKNVGYTFGIRKRDKWIDFLEQKLQNQREG